MKQSLQRITVWAKKHPWLAALIVGGVILLGYLVYKRGGGGGGAEGETMAPMPEGAAEVSPIPGMEGIPSPVTSGGGSSTSSGDLDTSPITGQPSPASFPELASIPPMSAGDFGGGWTAPDLGETVSASFAGPSSTTETKTETLKSAKGLGVAKASVFGTSTGGITSKASGLGKGKGKGKLGGKTQPEDVHARGLGIAPTVTTAPAIVKKTPKPATKPGRTPAERLGLYWLYTGPYNGLWYSFGYPIGAAPGSTSGGGSIGGSVKTSDKHARGKNY